MKNEPADLRFFTLARMPFFAPCAQEQKQQRRRGARRGEGDEERRPQRQRKAEYRKKEEQQTQEQAQEQTEADEGMVSADGYIAPDLEIQDVEIHITPSMFAKDSAAIGILLVVSVSIAGITIMRKKPKEILSEMS